MTSLNPTYTPNIPFRQHQKSKKKHVFLQSKVAVDSFNKSYLHYKLKLLLDSLSNIEGKRMDGELSIEKIPEGVFKILRRFHVYLKDNHYNHVGTVINICQQRLAERWNIDPSTVRRQMKLLQKLGVIVDSDGKRFKPTHPLFKHFDRNTGPKKQYFIDFEGIFEWVKVALTKKRLAHIYNQNSKEAYMKAKNEAITIQKEAEKVETTPDGPVDNPGINQPDSGKNERSYKNIHIFNKYKNKIIKSIDGCINGISKMFRPLAGGGSHRLSTGLDNGSFQELFSEDLAEKFLRMPRGDQIIYLDVKKKQITHAMSRSSPYSDSYATATSGLGIIAGLEEYLKSLLSFD
jgi:hypothetical protein